jgi:acyl carrier protein
MATESVVKKKVIGVIAACFKKPETEISEGLNLDTDFGADSLKYVELMSKLENEFEVMVPYADLRSNPTVGGIAQLVINLLKG